MHSGSDRINHENRECHQKIIRLKGIERVNLLFSFSLRVRFFSHSLYQRIKIN